jgi:hypothetical protein
MPARRVQRVTTYDRDEAPAKSADTRIPTGNVPQYDVFTPTFPRNSIRSHVAGKVANRNTMIATKSALNI